MHCTYQQVGLTMLACLLQVKQRLQSLLFQLDGALLLSKRFQVRRFRQCLARTSPAQIRPRTACRQRGTPPHLQDDLVLHFLAHPLVLPLPPLLLAQPHTVLLPWACLSATEPDTAHRGTRTSSMRSDSATKSMWNGDLAIFFFHFRWVFFFTPVRCNKGSDESARGHNSAVCVHDAPLHGRACGQSSIVASPG